MIKVLFVCMGNICRSPMAESLFRHLVAEAGLEERFEIDSAGTHEYHIGSAPHRGTQGVLRARGIEVGTHRARQVTRADFGDFDYVIAMDAANVSDMRQCSPNGTEVKRLLDFAPAAVRDVPDPYYTGEYDATYELVHAGAVGLLEHIRRERGV